MSVLVITKPCLATRADMTTFVYIPLVLPFFGLEWEGWYFTYSTLPFGWKASAYLYHSIGLAATCYVRSLGVPCSQYIDDRHIRQLRLPHSQLSPSFSGFQLAEMAAYIACVTFIWLGYFIGIKKSCLIPSVAVRFLRYICNSEKQAFLLPQEKCNEFAALRKDILSHKTVSLKNIQKFARKATSFALLVPAAKLFTSTAYQTISRRVKRANTQLWVSPKLRRELLHWRFLDSWEGFLLWKSERHIQTTLHSDASFSGWGGCLNLPGQPSIESQGSGAKPPAAYPSLWRKLTPSSTLLKVCFLTLILPGLTPLLTIRLCCTVGRDKFRSPQQNQTCWRISSLSLCPKTCP